MGTKYPELDWKQTDWNGVRLAFLETAPDGSARVLIDMRPGASYPEHRHVGTEWVHVIEGAYEDGAARYEAGSFQRFPAGSVHHPRACERGALLVARAERGIEVLVDAAAEAG